MFQFFKKSNDEKYLIALMTADGEWKITQDLHKTNVEFFTKNEQFLFVRENYLLTKKYYEITSENKREISEKFFHKIYKIASEDISRRQTEKVGGYILDDDLRKAISDTKKILWAHSQIDALHKQIQKIRNNYH